MCVCVCAGMLCFVSDTLAVAELAYKDCGAKLGESEDELLCNSESVGEGDTEINVARCCSFPGFDL